MSHPHSEIALQELKHLQAPGIANAALSFVEIASIQTAAWAVAKFGGQVLVDKVRGEYAQNPDVTADGEVIDLSELSGQRGLGLIYAQEEGAEVAHEVASDLRGALNRISRGYHLDTATVQGLDDTYVVIGSLEKALEANPEKLTSGEHHFQAAAGYMLEHMQEEQEDDSVEYLL
ncbi:MAG TPA: hypothetical protein VN031_01420 [Candidatus Microsaccharimonas sp.]|nr:hypothetical protein [Candidatus Microsaccharimonas sp.]